MASMPSTWITSTPSTAPVRRSRCPDGTVTATGAEIEILPDPTYGQIYRVDPANTRNVADTSQNYEALFVQDTWKIGPNLTLNPGLRYEHQHLTGTMADVSFGNEWAPRIGATWDPTGKGKMKVFGSWGWYFTRMPNDLAARALSPDAGISRADYFDANLTQPIPDGTLAAGTTSHFLQQGVAPDQIDPNVKAMYVNEIARRLRIRGCAGPQRWRPLLHRDIPRVLEDVQPYPIVAFDLGVPGTQTMNYVLTNPGPNTPVQGDLGASFENPIHSYNALEITADKRFANRWALQASYRYSRLRGTYEGFFRDDNGQSDPGITSLFDFPNERPELHLDWRAAIRLSAATCDIWARSERAAPARSSAPGQGVRQLLVRHGAEPRCRPPCDVRQAAHVARCQPGLRQPGRDSAPCEARLRHDRRLRHDTPPNTTRAFTRTIDSSSATVNTSSCSRTFSTCSTARSARHDPNTETTFLVSNPDFGHPSRFNLSQLETPRQMVLRHSGRVPYPRARI